MSRESSGKRENKNFPENRETVQAKHQVVTWDNPFFGGEMAKPIFLEPSVHCAESEEVKWKIPFFGVQTPRGWSQRKEGCKTPQGRVDRISIFSALGTYSQELPQHWYRCTVRFI